MHSLNAAIPSSAAYDLSSRTKTTAYVDWMPEASTQTHELLYTPDISEVVTEIVGQSGWTSGSPMAFIIEWVSGSGSRWVESTYTSSEYASLTGGAGVVPALEVLGVPPSSPPPPPPTAELHFNGAGSNYTGGCQSIYLQSDQPDFVPGDSTNLYWDGNSAMGFVDVVLVQFTDIIGLGPNQLRPHEDIVQATRAATAPRAARSHGPRAG